MISQRFLSLRSLVVRGVGCTLLGVASIGSAQAAFLNFRVEGLPSGLQVAASANFFTCPGATGTSQSSGGVELTEDSFTTIERITLPSGIERFVTTVHRFYFGTLQITPPTNNGCSSTPNGAFRYEYAVIGTNAAGALRSRTIGSSGKVLSGSSINIRDTLGAQTTQINRNGVVPTSLRLGLSQPLTAVYEDSAGGASIRNPTIEITRQTNFNGLVLNVSIARAVLNTSNQVCVTASGETVCRARSAGGSVTAGFLTVNLNALSNRVGGSTRTVDWSITINPSLGAGSVGVLATADDFDSISYFVNGNPADLDLLPWNVLRIPVELVN